MGNTKFYIVTFLVLGGLGFVGYHAFQSLPPATRFTYEETSERRGGLFGFGNSRQEEESTVPLRNEAIFEENPLEEVPDPLGGDTPVTNTPPATPTPAPQIVIAETPVSNRYQELIGRLERLANDGVIMDSGSKGTRVGTVQEFLNVYHERQIRPDNDYGPTTKERVRVFQQEQNLTADGQTGPNTYRAMITWLQTQE